jgi:uncharacterized membrane protein YcaP (DUF421 family)
MDHHIRVLIVQMAQAGLGIDDVIVDLREHGVEVDREDVKRIVLNAGGRIGATVRADGSGPNRESGR